VSYAADGLWVGVMGVGGSLILLDWWVWWGAGGGLVLLLAADGWRVEGWQVVWQRASGRLAGGVAAGRCMWRVEGWQLMWQRASGRLAADVAAGKWKAGGWCGSWVSSRWMWQV
jgi:hypothetical protein